MIPAAQLIEMSRIVHAEMQVSGVLAQLPEALDPSFLQVFVCLCNVLSHIIYHHFLKFYYTVVSHQKWDQADDSRVWIDENPN